MERLKNDDEKEIYRQFEEADVFLKPFLIASLKKAKKRKIQPVPLLCASLSSIMVFFAINSKLSFDDIKDIIISFVKDAELINVNSLTWEKSMLISITGLFETFLFGLVIGASLFAYALYKFKKWRKK